MDGLSRDDSGDRACCSVHKHALSEQDLEVPATDRVNSEKPVAVDVSNDESNLITVSVEEYGACAGGVDDGMYAAVNVGGDLISELRDEVANDGLDLLFCAGGSGCLQELSEEIIGHESSRVAAGQGS